MKKNISGLAISATLVLFSLGTQAQSRHMEKGDRGPTTSNTIMITLPMIRMLKIIGNTTNLRTTNMARTRNKMMATAVMTKANPMVTEIMDMIATIIMIVTIALTAIAVIQKKEGSIAIADGSGIAIDAAAMAEARTVAALTKEEGINKDE